jgi:hypothetical protein
MVGPLAAASAIEWEKKQIRHGALRLTHGGAGQGVWLDLEQTEIAALERLRGAMRQAAGERGLARARGADEQDDPMQRNDAAIDPAAEGEVQHRLRQELRLQPLVENDRFPQRAELRVRERTAPLNAFREVLIFRLYRRRVSHRRSLSCLGRRPLDRRRG